VAKRNQYEDRCSECGVVMAPVEGIVEAANGASRYRILCPGHAPSGRLDPPPRVEASKLPSIHLDQRFGR
jgi:hypothetical protein